MARNATVADAKHLTLAYPQSVLHKHMVLEKEDKEMAHKRKTVTDLEQRVVERKRSMYGIRKERNCILWD